MNYKLILIACIASMLLLSGCDNTKETSQAAKEATDKVGDMTNDAAKKMADMTDTEKAALGDVGTASQEAFDAALSAAIELTGKAAEKGGVWRDTGKLLKTAEKAASEGDFAKAIKLANTARMQSEAALQQSDSMQNAGPRF